MTTFGFFSFLLNFNFLLLLPNDDADAVENKVVDAARTTQHNNKRCALPLVVVEIDIIIDL
jgi:hypothetical protein